MRRARIKALATVPVRRKTSQNAITDETDNSNDNKDIDNKDNKDNNDNKEKNDIIKEDDMPASICQQNDSSDETNNKEKLIVNESHEIQESIEERQNVQSDSGELNSLQVTHHHEVSNTNINALGSPTKTAQNRSCFMRPVPRLNNSGRIRSNSIQGSGASASESEDDSKRITNNVTNRTRNDSMCSVQSNKEINSNNPSSNVTNKLKTGQKRRILISESARKLAEARREFLLKHENKTPDRTKLTMYDLIYYNPVTNPMKKSKESGISHIDRDSISQIDELEEEEREDDPSSMPVPQVKVGPDGQLIIDEQSLVIEQSHAKKSREVLAKKAIIDDDNYGSGFYKRRPKGKEWPKWETLKFYKALNIVGTDFLLMQTLFPNRTRQEIKLKYKKEERMNRRLIEKALEFHQEFSPEMEEELAKFEASTRQQFYMEQETDTKNKEKKKLKRRVGSRFAARSVGEATVTDDEITESEMSEIQHKDIEANNNQFLQRPRKRLKSNVKKTDEVMEEGKNACSTSGPESDSDAEIYQIRPTRSGRVPRVRKLQGPDINNLHNVEHSDHSEGILLENNKETIKSTNISNNSVINNDVYPDVITSAIPNIGEVEPGSVVILSKESPEEPGETVLQVYMVSSNVEAINIPIENDIVPMKTSSEVLTTTPNASEVKSIIGKKEQECDRDLL
ncbi:transcription factor TFIIIB component B'' homolog [Vespa mandarinia]|uniref:transcription factor TFIIIB component B'' homolog n=1 Tax=Vespa mandarinia TaxID=7446 RepID=UPI00160F6A18|nr:transcription factor TFIIIB component B'' homolog [Vespa mandarinia]XP_035734599.1 transcription factor TFIIIB component B'' homolog [Vespa mandarinia]XP_035734600.1 transcription factor TFIIIB component B'' homolog [Vespa mandarinia]